MVGLKFGDMVRLLVGEVVLDVDEVMVEDVIGGEVDGEMRYFFCW